MFAKIRVTLPVHLRRLANTEREVQLDVPAPITQTSVLDALEACYPALRGTMREHVTLKRRAFIRYFACGEDWTHAPADAELPSAVLRGEEPFMVVGAMAGGRMKP